VGASGLGGFFLFAGGEPDRGDDGRRILKHFPRMRAFSILPPEQTEKRFAAGLKSEPEPWEFPLEIRGCVELVIEIARQLGKSVTVVDVNRPGAQEGNVARLVHEGDLMPMLVAPSGARLEGLAEFTPGVVKKFLVRG
jgi:hypothetical protein